MIPAGLIHPDTRCSLRVEDVGVDGLLASADQDRATERLLALVALSYQPLNIGGLSITNPIAN